MNEHPDLIGDIGMLLSASTTSTGDVSLLYLARARPLLDEAKSRIFALEAILSAREGELVAVSKAVGK